MTSPTNTVPSREFLLKAIHTLAAKTVENGATHAEAQAASAKMLELLQKYNLSMSEAQSFAEQEQDDLDRDTVILGSRDHEYAARGQAWKRNLAYRVGAACFCVVLTSRATATFIGYKKDIEIAKYIYQYLITTLEEAVKSETKEFTDAMVKKYNLPNKSFLTGSSHPNTYRNSWLDGAVNAISKTLREQTETFTESSKNANALVISRQDEAQAHAEKLYPTVFKKKSGWDGGNASTNWDAYSAGKHKGAAIQIHKGVTQGAKSQQKVIDG